MARARVHGPDVSRVLLAIPSKYRSAVKAANIPEEALAVAERIRDETLAALKEIRHDLAVEPTTS